MDRRKFNRVCTSLLAGAAGLSQQAATASLRSYPTTLLVDSNNQVLDFNNLKPGTCLIFNYPFVTTPCFLIRLDSGKLVPGHNPDGSQSATLTDRAGQTYEWQGGVGPDHTLVAFSAICTHKMSHPAEPISHINFRTEEKEFFTDGKKTQQSQVIMCCSEHSIYDPADGARVLSGPAPQPLAAISLKVSKTGEISATGSYGEDMYDTFLEKFGFRLAMESGVSDPATLVGETSAAIPAAEFSRQQIRC